MRKRKRDISELNTVPLSKDSLSNYFTVVNDDNEYRYLMTRTLYVNGSTVANSDLYTNYNVQNNDHWTLISYKFYGSIDLWWLICKFNEIVNPYEIPVPGTMIKIPTEEFTQYVISKLQTEN